MFTKIIKICTMATSIMCTSLFAAPILTAMPPLSVDVTGAQSYGLYGDPGNTVWYFNVGANTTVTNITFDAQLSAYVDSRLSDMKLRFVDSSESTGVDFTLGFGDDNSGTKMYSGTIDLTAFDLAFDVGRDGILRLEFYEAAKQLPTGFSDGQWDTGILTFGLARAVPEPGNYPLIGIALLMLALSVRHRPEPSAAV